MQELASLVLSVDTRPMDAATVSMDKAASAADRLTQANERLAKAGSSVSATATAVKSATTDYVRWWKEATDEQARISKISQSRDIELWKNSVREFQAAEKAKLAAQRAEAEARARVESIEQARDIELWKNSVREFQAAEKAKLAEAKAAAAERERIARIEQSRDLEMWKMRAQAVKSAQSIGGIRSPQAVADELRSLAAARDMWEQAGKSAQGYAGAIAQINARTNVLTQGNARARGAIRETAAAMASLAFEAAGAAFLITAVGGALAAPAFFGTSMLKRVEDAQTGIAGILMSMGTLNGKALTFEQSMAASGEYVKKIQEDSLKFGIEMGRLVEVNQAAISGGLAAMLTLDQIQKVATAGAIAVSSLGLNSQQYVQEVRDLISGGIQPASSTLARSIGVTDALLKQWKAEGPAKLVGELTTRLEGFVLVADKVRASTLTGAWDILQARLAVLLSDEEGFGALKKVVIDVANYIGTFDVNNNFKLNPDLVATAKAYWEVLKAVGEIVVAVGSAIAALTPVIKLAAQALAEVASYAKEIAVIAAVWAGGNWLKSVGTAAVGAAANFKGLAGDIGISAASMAHLELGAGKLLGSLTAFARANPFLLVATGATIMVSTLKSSFDSATKSFDEFQTNVRSMNMKALTDARQMEQISLTSMKGSVFSGFNEADIRRSEDRIRILDAQINKMAELDRQFGGITGGMQDTFAKDYATQMEKRTAALAKFDTAYKQHMEVFIAAGHTEKQIQEEAVSAWAKRADVEKQFASGKAATGKVAKEAAVAENSYTESLRQSYVELWKGNDALASEIELIGKSKEQIDQLTLAKIDDTIATKDQDLARVTKSSGDLAQITLLTEEIRLLKERKTLIGRKADAVAADEAAKARAKAEQDAVAAQKKAYEDLWKSVDNFAHDAFMNITDKGKNAFAEIGKAIKKSILEMLYQMTVQKWILNISASGTGTAAGGAAASGGVGSWLQAGQSMWSAFSGGMAGSMGSLAVSAGEMLGSTAVMEFGAGMSGMAGAGVTGGMAGLGATIGAAMPYLAAALVAYNLLSGDKGKPTQNLGHAGMVFDAQGNVISSQTMYGGSSTGTDAQVRAMNAAYLQAAMSLGIGAVASEFRFGANTGGRGNSYTPQFSLSGGAGTASFTQAEIAQSDAAIQLAASKAVFAALQGSDLPQYLRSVFDGLTASTATQQQIEDTLAFAHSLKAMRESLLETRTPLEILRANVDAGTRAFRTSAATFKNDFVAAIDAGISPSTLAQWQQLGAAIDQLAQADVQAATQAAQAAQAVAQAAATREQSAIADLRAAVDAEKAQLTSAYNQQLDVMSRRVDSITASVSKLSELSNVLHSSVSTMGVGSTRAGAQAQISAVLAIARAGGVLPNAADIQDSLNIIAQPSEMLFGSFTDYMRDFIRTSNDIQALADISDSQLTEQESLLVLAQNQIDLLSANHSSSLLRLDGILSAALGTNAAVMTVASALGALSAAQTASAAAKATVTAMSPTVGASSATTTTAQKVNDMYRSVLGRSAESAGLSYWSEQAAAGMSLADIYYGISHSPEAIAKGVPQFAVGINEVPQDTLAMVHQGEEIKPRPFVKADRDAQKETVELLKLIMEKNHAMWVELSEIKRTNLRMWQTTEQWDVEGKPEVRTV